MWFAYLVALPKRNAGISTVSPQNVINHVGETESVVIAIVVAHDALQRVHAGIHRRHTFPHVFYDGMRAGNLDVFLTAAGCTRRTNILIGVATSADNWRVTHTAGKFPCQTARRGAA